MEYEKVSLILPVELLKKINVGVYNNIIADKVADWLGRDIGFFMAMIDQIEKLDNSINIIDIDISTLSFAVKNQIGELMTISLLPKVFIPNEEKIFSISKMNDENEVDIQYYWCDYDNVDVFLQLCDDKYMNKIKKENYFTLEKKITNRKKVK